MSCTCLLRASTRASTSRLAPRPFSSSANSLSSAPSPKPVLATPSSCPAGTAFPWTNLTKPGQAAVALEDSEYPAWLWTLAPAPGGAKAPKAAATGDAAGAKESVADMVAKLRKDGRSRIKAANTLKGK